MLNSCVPGFYGIEQNLFGEIILNGEVLKAGQEIIVLRGARIDPYESRETVFYGPLENSQNEGWQLLHGEIPNPDVPLHQLFARIPE